MGIMPSIVIDIEKCKNCGICMAFCPRGLIKVSQKVNSQGSAVAEFCDSDLKCTGCAVCAMSCPEIAIKEVRR